MAPITHPGPLLNATLAAAKVVPPLPEPTKVVQTYRLQVNNGQLQAVPLYRVKARVTLAISHSGRFSKEPPIDGAQTLTTLATDPTFAARVSEDFVTRAAVQWCRTCGITGAGRWGMLNTATDALNAILLRRKGIDPNGLLLRLGQFQTSEEASE